MFFLFKAQDKNRAIEKNEKSFSKMVPYKYHYDDNTILTTNNEMMSVIKLEGFAFQTADDEDVDNKKILRNNLFKGMAADGLSLCVHTIRRKFAAFPEGEFNNIFTEMLNEQWRKKHGPDRTFINEYYLTIIKKMPVDPMAKVKQLVGRFFPMAVNDNKVLQEAYADLAEVRDRLVNGLMSYKAKLLGIRKTEDGCFSEICEFLGRIANMCYEQQMLVPRGNISKYINTQRLYFGGNVIECFGPNYHKFAGIVSLKEYRPQTYAGILDGFLSMPCEFIMTQTYTFTDRQKAVSSMQLQQRRLQQSEDIAISQTMEINEALDLAMSGAFGFGLHHLTIMCIADDIKSLDDACSQATVQFSNVGIASVRENVNMEPCFWAQFPGILHLL